MSRKEGSLKFLNEFRDEHARGASVDDFAKVCNITRRHGYELVRIIAERDHISKASLLDFPHKQHSSRTTITAPKPRQTADIDLDDIYILILEAKSMAEKLIKIIESEQE